MDCWDSKLAFRDLQVYGHHFDLESSVGKDFTNEKQDHFFPLKTSNQI